MSDHNNRLHQFLDLKLDVDRDEATVAWLAMAAKGKQKGKDLQVASRIREAILADLVVNEEGCKTCGAAAGNIAWAPGAIAFKHEDDFAYFAKAVNKLVDDDGVDFGLSTAALGLQAQCEAVQEGIKAAAKKAKEAPATA
jgi:hypothetical protein